MDARENLQLSRCSLIVDAGNTFVKVSLIDNDEKIVAVERYKDLNSEILASLFERFTIDRAICCSVRELSSTLLAELEDRCRFFINFRFDTPNPIINHYSTPHTLGVDRLAAAIGASDVFKGSDILIIDFGSAITIDFIEKSGCYKGGNISPGAVLRFKSLNSFTNKLPLCSFSDKKIVPCADNTLSAIESGVVNGIIFETKGYIDYYKSIYPDLKIIFTGGDAIYFGDKFNMEILTSCEIVTKGLYRVLEQNDKK